MPKTRRKIIDLEPAVCWFCGDRVFAREGVVDPFGRRYCDSACLECHHEVQGEKEMS